MGWVRANRGRLVAACLTLCRAWIAAGRPRGTRSIGSYEAWAQVMGGVLGVAGIEGFLGNLDEMLAAADGEGAALAGLRRRLVGPLRHGGGRHRRPARLRPGGGAAAAPRIRRRPLADGSRLGKALGRMRDRVFRLDGITVRVEAAGIRHQAQRWRLVRFHGERRASASPSPLSRHTEAGVSGTAGEYREPTLPPERPNRISTLGRVGSLGSVFPIPTRARGHAPPRRERREALPTPPTLPGPSRGRHFRQPRLGRVSAQASPIPNPPAWLDGVP